MNPEDAPTNPEAELAYEARVHNRQALIAVAAGLLLVGASAIQLAGPHTSVNELTLDLIVANRRFPLDLIAAVVNGVASLAMAATLTYLHRCTQARNPEVKSWVKIVAIVGGVMAAITGIAYAILVAIKVHQFVTTGTQTYAEANHLTSTPLLLVLQLVGQASALLLAVAFVFVSLNALRAGLLTRFMGYLGIFAGALVLFQITQIPVVQGYWLAALAYLFSRRWPTGLPPAWNTGRAEPWPSSAEMRTRRAAAAGSGRGAGRPAGGGGGGLLGGFGKPKPAAEPQPAGAPADPSAAPTPTRTRSSTPKRKRKRRR